MSTVAEVNKATLGVLDPRNFVQPMKDALDIVRNEESTFPAQPSRMRSGHLNTWLREVGSLPASAFIGGTTAKGSLRWRKRPKRSSGDVIRPSEKMLAKWKAAPIVIALTSDGLVGATANMASYSGYVQGTEQASFHAETGWITTTQAEAKHHAQIAQGFVDQAMKLLRGKQVT